MHVGVRLLNGANTTLTECYLRLHEEGGGLLVEGSGTQAELVDCRIEPHDVDNPEGDSTTCAVVVNDSGAFEARKCYLKGKIEAEGAGKMKVLEPLKGVQENLPQSPAEIGCHDYTSQCRPKEDDAWNGLILPSCGLRSAPSLL